MWGLMGRITGERLESNVPGWLLNAAATYATIEYLRLLVEELGRDPDAYGFDRANTYSVFVQTWDRAKSELRSLAVGRHAAEHRAVGLIPDFYYIHHRGYRDLRREALASPAWRDRQPIVAWRGSVTGAGPYGSAAEIPRVRLALACRAIPMTDVAIFDVHSTMASVFPPEQIAACIAQHGLGGERWPMIRHGDYRYAIDIDGHANAWGLLEKLILGCCVLKVETPYEQWYYDRLRAWVHYVPVKADLSDLAERIDWCRANDERCAWIAHNGALLAASVTLEREIPRSCVALMAAANTAPG